MHVHLYVIELVKYNKKKVQRKSTKFKNSRVIDLVKYNKMKV